MLGVGTTVSLAPVASVQASEQEVSLSLDIEQSLPSGEKDNIVTSNDNSENSAAKNTIDRDHDVKQASAAGERALDMHKSIETPNKDIEIDVETPPASQASQSSGEGRFDHNAELLLCPPGCPSLGD